MTDGQPSRPLSAIAAIMEHGSIGPKWFCIGIFTDFPTWTGFPKSHVEVFKVSRDDTRF